MQQEFPPVQTPFAIPQPAFQDDEAPPDDNEDYTEVFAWGNDMRGQLGINSRAGKSYALPKLVCFHTVIQELSCGEDHAALITSQGYLYTMGSNQDGKLGIGSSRILSANVPTLVESLDHSQLVSVSCGWTHTVALTATGQVYSWGLSEQGALGHGKIAERAIYQPVLVNHFAKQNLAIRQVSCGSMHTAFVTENGELYACGNGNEGQLGLGKKSREYLPKAITRTPEPVERVACGIFHTCFISTSGHVYAMGGNNFGQLGNGTKKRSLTPIVCKALQGKRVRYLACGHHSAAVTDQGELYVWGTGVFGEYLSPQRFQALDQDVFFKHVSIGGTFGAAVSKEGSVWTWGMNTNGELGVGDNEPRLYPVAVQSIHHKNVEKVSCGGSFALSTGTVVHETSSTTPPTEMASPSVRSTVPAAPDQNIRVKAPASSRKPTQREFGGDLGNSSILDNSSQQPAQTSFQSASGEGGLNGYIELLKRQKDQLETELLQEKQQRQKQSLQLQEIRESSDSSEEFGRRSRELEKEVNSLKYALGEERARVAQLTEELARLKQENQKLKIIQQPIDEPVDQELREENENLRKELKALEGTLTQQAKQNFHLEQKIAALEAAGGKLEPPKPIVVQAPPPAHSATATPHHRSQSQATAVSVASTQPVTPKPLISRLSIPPPQSRPTTTLLVPQPTQSISIAQLSARLDEKRDEHLAREPQRKQERYERPPSVRREVVMQQMSPIKKQQQVERVDISPKKQQQSEYGTAPSYKERRVNQSTDQLWRPREEKVIKLTPTPKKETFADVAPDVRKQRARESPPRSSRRTPRVATPSQHSDIFQSPKKPEVHSPIKDDMITSSPVRSRSCYHQAPPRQPCGFTKTPEINVITPNSVQAPEKTPKFVTRTGSNIEDSINLPERGRQFDSYQQKLLRDLQRSVGSPFGAPPPMKRPELRSELKFPIPYDVKLNDGYMDRSAHKLYALTSK